MIINELKAALADGRLDEIFTELYGAEKAAFQRDRYTTAIDEYSKIYGADRDVNLFSVPGRSEISGNHTDHNHGRVIAASIDLDIIAVASKRSDNFIKIKSEGFMEDSVDITNLLPDDKLRFTSAAIISGMCSGFKKNSFDYGAFDAYTTSNVFKGSGLSSSAAFEVMVGNILNHYFNNGAVSAPEIAKIAQYSENIYFGKPCGLMDQTACAVGGFVAIDFNDPANPVIEKLNFDLSAHGYSLCIVNTGGNHADLNDDYASIPEEMKAVAAEFGQAQLRGLTYCDIFKRLPEIRYQHGDRAILRALHFIEENDRVLEQTLALKSGDLDGFLNGVTASGNSSYKKLQNVFTTINVNEQGLSLALAIAEHQLAGKKAACRVHGGGFAGTIQAFVPSCDTDEFRNTLDAVFGKGACAALKVRKLGAVKLI